ncbi:MAG: holdfast attachment protein HfaA [Alphaproteobacteria bacterium]|nr:holdfast attachment protein HfaA [Alphaproteobacteria bacterium]
MTHTKKLIALAVLALSAPTAALAGDWTNSGMYNGYGSSNMNTASNYSMRDANGNLTMVNGQVTSAQYSANSGGQSAYAGGVGTGGANAYGQATAIGNSLNVTVIGSHNTTIIDSSQVNTGNQTATADLNSH